MYIYLEDMEYTADTDRVSLDGGYNEYYTGTLDNGDIVMLSKHGFYENRRYWTWAVYTPDDYPIQYYQSSRRDHECETPEECLEDMEECFEPRNWMTTAEYREEYGNHIVRCTACGWEGSSYDLGSETVMEDFGDVSCAKCPSCGTIEYDGMGLFEDV